MAFPKGSGTTGLRFTGADPPKWLGPKAGTETQNGHLIICRKVIPSTCTRRVQQGPLPGLKSQDGTGCVHAPMFALFW